MYNQTDSGGSRQTTAVLTETRLQESRGMAIRIIVQCEACGQLFERMPCEALRARACSPHCRGVLANRARTPYPPVAERFWEKVDKTPGQGPDGDCWIWNGSSRSRGYGQCKMNGKLVGVHKVSYLINKGSIPEGLCVLHKCDIRSCVRPEHLWLGTVAENNADKIAKGRARNLVGSEHPSSKITEAQAVMILNDPRKYQDIADEYGISIPLVSHIKTGRAWKHIPRT